MTEAHGGHSLLHAHVLLPFLLVGTIWGSTWVVLADQLHGAPPSWSVVYRFAIAIPAMMVYARVSRASLKIGGRAHALAMLVGFTQFSACYNLIYRAEVYLTSGIVGVMTTLVVVPNAVFGWLILGQRVTWQLVLGGVLSLSGAGLLLAHEVANGSSVDLVWRGGWYVLVAQVLVSLGAVSQAGKTGRSLPIAAFLTWAMGYGLVVNLIFALWSSGFPVLPGRTGYWLGLFYLAVIGSVVPFPFYFRLVRDLGPGLAGYSNVIVLTVAMLLSTVFEGYRWSFSAAAGLGLCLAGLVAAMGSRRHAEKPAE